MSVKVEATYLGYRDGEGYWVNVKNANPAGKIGDGGVIRRFETKEEAKNYTKEVNSTGVDTFSRSVKSEDDKIVFREGDEFVSSSKNEKIQNNSKVSDISLIRATTGFLTQEQVDKINETRKLPNNLKIVPTNMGGYYLAYNNYLDIGPSIHTVPEGFELKKDITGYVHIMPNINTLAECE